MSAEIDLATRLDDYATAVAAMELLAEVELESRVVNGRPDHKLYEAAGNVRAIGEANATDRVFARDYWLGDSWRSPTSRAGARRS